MPILDKHAALYTDFYELTMAQGYFLNGMAHDNACFDFFFRKLPFNGGYAIYAGLSDLLDTLQGLTFDKEDIQYLKGYGFHDDFLKYLEGFEFTCSIDSVPEGEVVFPNEPILKVEGAILEAQIIETLVLNTLNFQTLIATKASRVKHSAGKRQVVDFGLRRAQGLGGIHASKAAVIGGVESTSNVYSAARFGLRVAGTMAHSWIQSFDNELDAFRTFARIYPEMTVLLVDTYSTLESGVPHAIQIGHEMAAAGHSLKAIRLDSGDLAYLSKRARAMLDQAGLQDVKIMASNQLDEHIIKSLLDQGACIDSFGVGTSLVIGREDAALDGVYKLSMSGGKPKFKISENIEKILLPGKKKIFRYFDENKRFYADAVLMEDESEIDRMIHPYQPLKQLSLSHLEKETLLKPVMKEGKVLAVPQNPYHISEYSASRLARLGDEYKRFENPHAYKVGISGKLMALREELIKQYSSSKG